MKSLINSKFKQILNIEATKLFAQYCVLYLYINVFRKKSVLELFTKN